jgi:sugar lactone lactonase YvrE
MLIYIFPAPAQDLDLHGNPTLRPPYEAPAPPSSALKGAGGPPVILHVIPSQVSYTEDIAWDGKYLWVEGYNTNTLYQLSPVDGSIVKTIPSNVMRPYGLAFGDNSLWVADTDNHLIQQVDTSNGNVLSSFPTPAVFGGSYPTGLAWDGTQLWHNDAMATGGGPNDSTYYISTAGQVLQHYHGFGTYITGLAWDGQYLWSNDNPSQLIYKIDPVTFTALGVISAPGGAYPNGLAFDGQYLWVANNTTDSIYKIDTASVTGIGDKFETTGFTTFPNPVSQTLTIEIPPSALGSDYIISDALGRRVLEGRCLSTYSPVDMSDQPPGWYICRLAGINAPAVFLKLRE